MNQHDQDRNISSLLDQRRAIAAQLAGVDLELAMAAGDREAAERHLQEMNAQTAARIVARLAQEGQQS